jgi:hypothetical protein
MSALENETLANSTTFDALGRSWTVPTKRNAAHLRWMQHELRLGVVANDLMVAEAFLSPAVSKSNQQKPDQFADLMALEPDEDKLDEFASSIAKALGLGDSGNS